MATSSSILISFNRIPCYKRYNHHRSHNHNHVFLIQKYNNNKLYNNNIVTHRKRDFTTIKSPLIYSPARSSNNNYNKKTTSTTSNNRDNSNTIDSNKSNNNYNNNNLKKNKKNVNKLSYYEKNINNRLTSLRYNTSNNNNNHHKYNNNNTSYYKNNYNKMNNNEFHNNRRNNSNNRTATRFDHTYYNDSTNTNRYHKRNSSYNNNYNNVSNNNYHRKNNNLLTNLLTLEDHIFPYLIQQQQKQIQVLQKEQNKEDNNRSQIINMELKRQQQASKTNTNQLYNYFQTDNDNTNTNNQTILFNNTKDYNNVIKTIQDIIIGYTKLQKPSSFPSLVGGSLQDIVNDDQEENEINVLLAYPLRAEVWYDILQKIKLELPQQPQQLQSSSSNSLISKVLSYFTITNDDNAQVSGNNNTQPSSNEIKKYYYNNERLISLIIQSNYAHFIQNKDAKLLSLEEINLLSTTIDRLYTKIEQQQQQQQMYPSIIQQILSIYADCQSPILAIHSYKQYYLNSKLYSNNIDIIKLMLRVHSDAISSNKQQRSSSSSINTKYLLENMEHIFFTTPKKHDNIEICNTLLQAYLRYMNNNYNPRTNKTILRKIRKLKIHNPNKETNQYLISIYTKAAMTTTASNNNHNYTNDSNTNYDHYLKLCMKLLFNVDYNTSSSNEVLRMIKALSSSSIKQQQQQQNNNSKSYINMANTIVNHVQRPNYETFILPLLIHLQQNTYNTTLSSSSSPYAFSEQIVSKMESAFQCGTLQEQQRQLSPSPPSSAFTYPSNMHLIYRLLLQDYALASKLDMQAVYRAKLLLDKIEYSFKINNDNITSTTSPSMSLSFYTLFFDACAQASYSYPSTKIDVLPLAEEVYNHVITNHSSAFFSSPSSATSHGSNAVTTIKEKINFFSVFLVVIAKSSAGRQKRKSLSTKVIKDIITLFSPKELDYFTNGYSDGDNNLMRKMKHASIDVYRQFVLEDSDTNANGSGRNKNTNTYGNDIDASDDQVVEEEDNLMIS